MSSSAREEIERMRNECERIGDDAITNTGYGKKFARAQAAMVETVCGSIERLGSVSYQTNIQLGEVGKVLGQLNESLKIASKESTEKAQALVDWTRALVFATVGLLVASIVQAGAICFQMASR